MDFITTAVATIYRRLMDSIFVRERVDTEIDEIAYVVETYKWMHSCVSLNSHSVSTTTVPMQRVRRPPPYSGLSHSRRS